MIDEQAPDGDGRAGESQMDREAAALDAALGEAVRVLRVTRRWSQPRLAKVAGMSDKTVGRIERGERSMSMPQAFAIASAFGIDLAELVRRAQNPAS